VAAYIYYPDTNRLQTITGTHAEMFLYDDDGNITQRIPGAGNPNPTITTSTDFTYNNAGLRSQKQSQSQSLYHYDLGGQLIAETDTDGTLIKAYVWLHGQPLSMITQDGSIYYFHNDHLGTPQRITDSNGNLVWSADYLPFGQADVTVESVENNIRFPGQYRDGETGLHYNLNRYYDPGTGRYLTADPIGLNGGMNLYAYVGGNPISRIDPEGLKDCKWKCKAVSCGCALLGCSCNMHETRDGETRSRRLGLFYIGNRPFNLIGVFTCEQWKLMEKNNANGNPPPLTL